jgi:drug/metabolite transporter (DMT)-like permease
MISTFIAVKYMQLADVVYIAQATPVFVTILSIIFLKEVVGYRRWLSVIAGLIGILFITKLGTSLFNVYSIFPIFFCIGFSIVAFSIKRLSKTEPDYLIAFYFTALLIIVSSTAFFLKNGKSQIFLIFFIYLSLAFADLLQTYL